jgi:hypothetical protein
MQLLTKAIKAKLPSFTVSTCQTPNTEFVCKFFDPCGSWTWYVLEGEEVEDGDWRFYGLVDGFEREWGYFMLSELESVRGPLGLGIERDLHFEDVPIVSVCA